MTPDARPSPLVIVGAGGLGRETAALVSDINTARPTWDLLGFVDDRPGLHSVPLFDLPVLGDVEWLCRQTDLAYVLAVGSSLTRARLGRRLAGHPLTAATLTHPTVALSPSVAVGAGTIIFRGVIVMLAVTLGTHVVLDVNTTVGHDSILGDYTTAHPGVHLSGDIRIGEAVELGAGSVVLPGVAIGNETVVGAGAVVTRPLPAHCTAVGVPARPLGT